MSGASWDQVAALGLTEAEAEAARKQVDLGRSRHGKTRKLNQQVVLPWNFFFKLKSILHFMGLSGTTLLHVECASKNLISMLCLTFKVVSIYSI